LVGHFCYSHCVSARKVCHRFRFPLRITDLCDGEKYKLEKKIFMAWSYSCPFIYSPFSVYFYHNCETKILVALSAFEYSVEET
jgi:hypothetical protein